MLVRGRPAGRCPRGRRRGAPVAIFAVGLVTATVLALAAPPAAADPLLPGPNPIDALAQDLFDRIGGGSPGADDLAAVPGALAPPLPALPALVPLAPALSGLLAASDASASAPVVVPTAPGPSSPPNADGTTRLTTGPLRETGTNPILELARSSTALLVLTLAAAMFLAFEAVHARHDPRLTAAPLERRDAELEFE